MPSLRPVHNTLTGLTGLQFQEGLIQIPDKSEWAHDRMVSIAVRPPADPTAPIFVFVHGASQEKTSFSHMIRAMHQLNPSVGFGALDILGAGETLERNLPLNYELPLAQNAQALIHLVKSIRAQHPTNPIVLAGVSYGSAIILKAAGMDREFKGIYSRAVAMAFADELQGIEDAKAVKTHLQRLLWPAPGNDLPYFQRMAAREIFFSQSFLSEPIVLRSPFPFTIEALVRLYAALREGELRAESIAENLREHSLDVVIAGEDQYFADHLEVLSYYQNWKATRTVMVMQNTEHKVNEANPAFTAAWLLELATNPKLRSEVYLGHPSEGEVVSLSSDYKLQLPVRQRSFSAHQVWMDNYQRAYRSWADWRHLTNPTVWSAASSIGMQVWTEMFNQTTTSWAQFLQNPNPQKVFFDRMSAYRDFMEAFTTLQRNTVLRQLSLFQHSARGQQLQRGQNYLPHSCELLF